MGQEEVTRDDLGDAAGKTQSTSGEFGEKPDCGMNELAAKEHPAREATQPQGPLPIGGYLRGWRDQLDRHQRNLHGGGPRRALLDSGALGHQTVARRGVGVALQKSEQAKKERGVS
jgi:hypothetical protein